MPGTPTARFQIPTLAGTDLARDIDAHVNNAVTAIDTTMVGYGAGPIASRPTSSLNSPGVAGRFYLDTDSVRLYFDYGKGWLDLSEPVGTIVATARASAPDGWRLCDGTPELRAALVTAELFATIGTTYGSGNGSTTFNLPDLRGRVPAGRDTGQQEFDVLGEAIGKKAEALTTAQMPSHSHSGPFHSHNVSDPGHGHLQMDFHPTGDGWGDQWGQGSDFVYRAGMGPWVGTGYTQGAATGISIQPGGTGATGPAGSGEEHNNIQPSLVVNWIIKL